MNEYMKRAVELAEENVQDGGRPFGAVLVKDGKIVQEGVNELHHIHDVSGHAELLVIRREQKDQQTNDLSDYSLYASGHPCPMCLTAMYYVGIKDAYYCQSLEEAKEAGLTGKLDLYEELSKPNDQRQLKMTQQPLSPEDSDPMANWARQQDLKNQ